jgi:L-fuconolactonase
MPNAQQDSKTMTRRESLALIGAASFAPCLKAERPAPTLASRIIDTHTHFYDPTRPGGVPWPGEKSPLYRAVYPKDWAALAAPHGIHETVVVEASAWLQDNDWILELAAKEKSIIGFIGNVQPSEPDFAKHIKRLAGNPLFKGIRLGAVINQGLAEPLTSALKVLSDHGLTLDVNGVKDLNLVAAIAAQYPELRIVIDHCGGCGDAQKLKPEWAPSMAACAKHSQVFCKVSALVEMTDTPPGKAPTDVGYYLPVVDHLWQCFGPERLVFGSNWPVSDKGAPFDTVIDVVGDYFTAKGKDACERYFWQNSKAAYRW